MPYLLETQPETPRTLYRTRTTAATAATMVPDGHEAKVTHISWTGLRLYLETIDVAHADMTYEDMIDAYNDAQRPQQEQTECDSCEDVTATRYIPEYAANFCEPCAQYAASLWEQAVALKVTPAVTTAAHARRLYDAAKRWITSSGGRDQ
jgi:hypothetical protein